jgi:alpha-tubulin suppressor-like RCC1 family protein
MPFIQDSQDATANFAKISNYSGWANFPSAQAFGNNSYGQLGVNTLNAGYSSPVALTNQLAYPAWIDAAYLRNGLGLAFVNQNNQPFFAGQAVADTTGRSSPVQVGGLSIWTSLLSNDSSSNSWMAAIKNNNTLWTWGLNSFGQLGLGDIVNRSSPIQVGTLSAWTSVSGGYEYTLALQSPGTLWAWGNNSFGQLGTNTSTLSNVISPVQIGALSTWVTISGGAYFSLAILSNGTLWSWGSNSYGQLGLNTSTNYSSPVQVGALSSWSQVFPGFGHSVALQSNGTLWTWGLNSFGQLGQNNQTNYSSPVQVGALTTWTKISAGVHATFALQSNGTLWSCGRNAGGQLGLGDLTDRSSLTQVGSLSSWSQVTSSYEGAFAIQSPGTLWAWGLNNVGQVGINTSTFIISSPVQVGTLSAWTQISGVVNFVSAIQNNGTLWAWGSNSFGQLGQYNPAAYSLTNYPSQFNTANYNKVAASNSQSYFRRTADNTLVQTSTVDIPTIDTTNSIAWTSYDTGQYHFVGVQTNGTAWSIGNNSYGQLGLNTTTSSYSSLTQIGSGTNWSRAVAADYGSMLIDNSNNAWVFGKNNQYQLGLSDTTNRSSPVQITYATGIQNAAMDDYDIWLVDGSNNLWGGGVGNKVSANTTTNFTYPTQKFVSNFWNNVATNQDTTLLVSVNSTVYGFGNNTYGQLGISANTNTYQYSPVQIGSINTTTKVETKAGSSIILFK